MFLLETIALANNNKIFWGLTMLLMNFGSRYLIGDLGKAHEKILTNQLVKRLIVFSLFFVATRDIITAFLLTMLYIFIIDGLLHEKSKFCIVPKKMIDETTASSSNSNQYKKNLAYLHGAP